MRVGFLVLASVLAMNVHSSESIGFRGKGSNSGDTASELVREKRGSKKRSHIRGGSGSEGERENKLSKKGGSSSRPPKITVAQPTHPPEEGTAKPTPAGTQAPVPLPETEAPHSSKPTKETTTAPTKNPDAGTSQPTPAGTETPVPLPETEAPDSNKPTTVPTKNPEEGTSQPTSTSSETSENSSPVDTDIVPGNFCGFDYTDALKCGLPCPGGQNNECPDGESCFSSIPCAAALATPVELVPANYCGILGNWEDAEKCLVPCPGGDLAECPVGETCYAGISCSLSHGGTAAAPTTAPVGTPTLDPGQVSPAPTSSSSGGITPANFCGFDASDAFKCGVACKGGTSDECPEGESCYASIPCDEANATLPPEQVAKSNYCGLIGNWADAEKCQISCPNGFNSECPEGEACYADITCP